MLDETPAGATLFVDTIEQATPHSEGRAVHLILQANHPSPLSATRAPAPFIGCGHFGQAQAFWRAQGHALDWALT